MTSTDPEPLNDNEGVRCEHGHAETGEIVIRRRRIASVQIAFLRLLAQAVMARIKTTPQPE